MAIKYVDPREKENLQPIQGDSGQSVQGQNLGIKGSPNPPLKNYKPVDNSEDLGSFVNSRKGL